jgi:hypothetical protein
LTFLSAERWYSHSLRMLVGYFGPSRAFSMTVYASSASHETAVGSRPGVLSSTLARYCTG